MASRGPMTPMGTRSGCSLSFCSQAAAARAPTFSHTALFSAERTNVHVRVIASKRRPCAS